MPGGFGPSDPHATYAAGNHYHQCVRPDHRRVRDLLLQRPQTIGTLPHAGALVQWRRLPTRTTPRPSSSWSLRDAANNILLSRPCLTGIAHVAEAQTYRFQPVGNVSSVSSSSGNPQRQRLAVHRPRRGRLRGRRVGLSRRPHARGGPRRAVLRCPRRQAQQRRLLLTHLALLAAGNLAVADLTTGRLPGTPGYGVPNGILNNDDFFLSRHLLRRLLARPRLLARGSSRFCANTANSKGDRHMRMIRLPAARSRWARHRRPRPAVDCLVLHPPGATSSAAFAVSDSQVAGHVYTAGVARATRWSGVAFPVAINPPNGVESFAYAIDNEGAIGGVVAQGSPFPTNRATYWTPPASAFGTLDLNPSGATHAALYGVAGDRKVGEVELGGTLMASLWDGPAHTWIDLHPPMADWSGAHACDGSQIVGVVASKGVVRAALWNSPGERGSICTRRLHRAPSPTRSPVAGRRARSPARTASDTPRCGPAPPPPTST